MRHLSRRHFLANASALAITAWSFDLAIAGINNPGGGSASVALNNNRVTINAPTGYRNLAKGFGLDVDPNNASADGYPVSLPSVNLLARSSPSMDPNYTGTYVWKWAGTAAMQLLSTCAIIVISGGADIFGVGANTDYVGSTMIRGASVGATNPRIEFYFGWNIQSVVDSGISNGAGGTFIKVTTKTNFFNSFSTGQALIIGGILTQTNANGSWTVTKIDAQSFYLNGSTWSAGQGTSGVVGRATYGPSGMSININASGTFSGMSNLVFCKSTDETPIANGLITDATLVSQLQYLFNHGASTASRGWLRFMDSSGVQSSFENNFSQRTPVSYLSYSASRFCAGFWAPSSGAITNGGSDDYTCGDPSQSVWNGSSYIDGATVQGSPNVSNTTGNPTLNVGGHGAKPIYDSFANHRVLSFAGTLPASAGLTMTFQFSATWLNGGSPLTLNYTTVSGDTSSFTTLNINVRNAILANTTLSNAGIAPINFPGGNSTKTPVLCRAAVVTGSGSTGTGPLTITYTAGPASVTIVRFDTNAIQSVATPDGNGNTKDTFVFNYLLDGWIYRSGGATVSIPLEAIVDMCNQVGANCWFNYGITSGPFVTATSNLFKTTLSAGLKYGFEVGNEMWNSGANPYAQFNSLGHALNFSETGNNAVFCYTSLRTLQYAALSKAAWISAGGAASDHYVFQMHQVGDNGIGGNFDAGQLRGTNLNASTNVIYGALGSLTGGAEPSHNAYPNRPVDITTSVGMAPYWNSHWLGQNSFTDATQLVGSATSNSPVLQSALDFANGLTSTAFMSMVNQFNGTTVRTVGNNFGTNLADYQSRFTNDEALLAQYDGANRTALGLPPIAMMDYEGGPSFGMGANGNNGVNSSAFNNVASGDITALANRMTALDSPPGTFTVSTWTSSGTDNKTEMATMVLTMLQAWKFDVDRNGNAANTGAYKDFEKVWYYQARVTTSGAQRETKPARYGYAAQNWSWFPVTFRAGGPYTDYIGTHEFNAGG